MAKATWLGDDGGTYSISQYGKVFERGQAVDVADLSDAQRAKLEGNPQFAFDKQKAEPVKVDDDEEAERLREHLKAHGVNFHHNTGLAKLRSLAADLPGPTPVVDVLQQTGVSQDHAAPVGTVTEIAASRTQAAAQNGGE